MQKHFEKLFSCYILHGCALLLTTIFSLICTSNSYGQHSFSGFFQNYSAFQIYNNHELVAGRNRFRGQFETSLSFGSLYAEVDLIDRYTNARNFELQPRQIYVDWYTSNYDIRIGKQNIIWGQSTGAFVTDILTPVDLREFLTQDPSDLRIGVTALNIQRFFGSSYLQFIASPALQENLLPSSDSRWFPVQRPPTFVPITFRSANTEPSLSTFQLAARFAWRPRPSLNIDFLLYHWAHPMPAYTIQPQNMPFQFGPEVTLREAYKTTPMAGYSVMWQASDRWILLSEGLIVSERLFTFLPVAVNRLEDALGDPVEAIQVLQEFDIRNDGYLLTKPWLQNMVGLQTSIKGATVGAQAYLEVILNYEDRILPQRIFPYVSGFAQKSFLRDRLQVFINGRYNFFGEDFWVQTQAGYEIRDGFEFTLGTNIFDGPSISPFYGHLTFQQFRENSFIFGKTSVYF